MRVGSLVKYNNFKAKGLVLKRIKGRTFDEVLIVWFNPDWVAHHRISSSWESLNNLVVISR